jgi:hypothetical protein
MSRMPDLPSLHHINDIVMVAPKVLKLFFEPTVVAGEQGITNGQAFTTTGIIGYMGVYVIQDGN